jgi:N-acetyl-anhydromuramoyl-L-alanine amidase
MQLEADGWLTSVRRLASPNADERPPGTSIDLLVIHCISLPPERYGGPWIDALFTNTLDCDAHPYFEGLRGLRVSSHLLLRRDGSLTQYVALHRRAWHAGVSVWEGRERCNDYSIGIELEGDEQTPYTVRQYRRLASVTRVLTRAYPAITPARIVGHSDIAPDRKTDPGPSFNWERYRRSLHQLGA